MMMFLLFAPASTKWLGWRKDRKSRRDRLGHRVLRRFLWINELLSHLEKCLTCRLARLISPVGSLWIYCKRFLRFLSDRDLLCYSPFLKITNRRPYPRWRTARRPKGDRGTKCQFCEPSRSLGLRYIECVTRNCNAIKITHFFNGFRRVFMF